jgi:protein-disulfide isomerase
MRLLLLPLALLAACSRSPDAVQPAPAPQPPAAAQSTDAIVARIGNRSIMAADADASIVLALHDLDMQKYRLRRQALEGEVLRQLENAPGPQRMAEIRLEPPTPPRLPVQADPDRLRPASDEPVTVLAFCNFESPHCARLQRTLSQVLPLFPGVVRFGARDLPLEFHRHAGQAAEAARCAAEQGNYWRFHDLLYAGGGAPDRAMLERASRAASLDPDAFAACLDTGRHAAAVANDVALARSLGLSTVPSVFVNGLYASPDVKAADLVWLIERELASLGRASPRLVPAEASSTAPFRLRALLVSATAGQGLAVVAPSAESDRVAALREGDAIATDLVVRRIDARGVELLRGGQAERLGFDTVAAAPEPPAGEPSLEELAAAHPHRAVPVTLDRERVLVLMSDRIALDRALERVPMPGGDGRLLRLERVEPGSLYELLGMQSGDVLISVNEQPATEAFNPLWDALEKEGEVRVRVIRRGGLAQHFTYRFGD